MLVDALEVTGPAQTVVVVNVAEEITFAGTGLADGDKAKFVASSASDCSGAVHAAEQTIAASKATFTFTVAGVGLKLCYQHKTEAYKLVVGKVGGEFKIPDWLGPSNIL